MIYNYNLLLFSKKLVLNLVKDLKIMEF